MPFSNTKLRLIFASLIIGIIATTAIFLFLRSKESKPATVNNSSSTLSLSSKSVKNLANQKSNVDKESTIKLQESFEADGTKYSIVEYDAQTVIEGVSEFGSKTPIKYTAPEGKKFARFLLKRDTSTSNSVVGVPSYYLIDKNGERLQNIFGFKDGYEEIDVVEGSIPEKYQDIEEKSNVETKFTNGSSRQQTIYFRYTFFLIDENKNLNDFDFQFEALGGTYDGQKLESYRVTVDI